MLHTAAKTPSEPIDKALNLAHRRAQGAKRLLDLRRAQLGARLQQVVSAGPCQDAGPRYVLAQNLGAVDCPLWAFLSIENEATGQLVFSGNRKPVEFSGCQAMELAPQLGAFMRAVEFRPVAAVSPARIAVR